VAQLLKSYKKGVIFHSLKHLNMKLLAQPITMKMFLSFLILSLIQTVLWAQDSGSSSSTTTKSTDVKVSETSETWYASPWVWVAAAAVFILLLVALTRGSSSRRATDTTSDRVSVTKTVERDTDTDTV
jgi:hypothetical protein